MMHCVRRPDARRFDTRVVPHPAVGKLASGTRGQPSLEEVSSPERQHPRFAADVAIKFHVGTQATAGRTRNVSRGGLCADTDEAMAIGMDVELEMTLVFEDKSVSEPLRLPARIVWCTPFEGAFQVGVSFRPLDKQRAEYLSLFLKYLGDDKPQKTPKAANIDDRFR
jgi:Tfp pilus assembly protein PilZ